MSMLQLRYSVPGDDFTRAGEASGDVKHKLKKLGYNPSAIRRVSIAMYEGEINMVIHAGGGEANVDVDPDKVVIVLTDHGPGIADVEKAMQEGWSTAPDNVRSLGFGAGMGLPNMKKYSDEMTIDSQEDSGAFVSVDRQEVLDLMENYLQPYGTIKAVTISDDVMIVSMSGMNLQEISAMFEILQQQLIVKAADLTIASTEKTAGEDLDFSVTITLQPADTAEGEATA